MDRKLSIDQLNVMLAKFDEVDQEMGFLPEKYENFVQLLGMISGAIVYFSN